MVKLSICVTTFNLKNVINKTLQSIFDQKTDYSFEILAGDDGSNDGTIDEIKKWQSKYPDIIKLFVMDRDSQKKYSHIDCIARASSNRYNLLKHSNGEYVTFLDGDDFYIDKNKIQKQISILENNLDCNLCAHNINYYYEQSNKTRALAKERFYQKTQKISFRKFWEMGLYVHAESCIIRNNFDINSQNEEFFKNYFDDNFIIYMALQKGKCFYIPDLMVNYRQNENGFFNWDQTERNLIDLLDLDAEVRYNPHNKKMSIVRHYSSINKLLKNKGNMCDKYPIIYKKAKNDCAQLTVEVMEKRFSIFKWNLLKFKIIPKKILFKIKKNI